MATVIEVRSKTEQQDRKEPFTYRELRLLAEIERDSEVTQRDLSRRVGIALGLTNALLRNLVQKGYVRATQAGWKRWMYNLTPEGFSHKSRMTVSYIRRFLDHYQQVRQSLREELAPLTLHEESRVAIYGTGEFAELVFLALKELGIEEIEIFGPGPQDGRRFLGMPVQDRATLDTDQYDRVVIALLHGWERAYEQLRRLGGAQEKLVTLFADGKIQERV